MNSLGSSLPSLLAATVAIAIGMGAESIFFTFARWLKSYLPRLDGGNRTGFFGEISLRVESMAKSIIETARSGYFGATTDDVIQKRNLRILASETDSLMTKYDITIVPESGGKASVGRANKYYDDKLEIKLNDKTRHDDRRAEATDRRRGLRERDRNRPEPRTRGPRTSRSAAHVNSVLKKKKGKKRCPYCNSDQHSYTRQCPAKVHDIINNQPGAHATEDYREHQSNQGRKMAKVTARTVPLPSKMLPGLTDQEREKAIKKGRLPKTTEYYCESDSDNDSGEEDKVPAKTERKVNAAVHFDDETSEETDDSGSESASEGSYSEYEYESEASDEDE